MTISIREIGRADAGAVTDLYLDVCRRASLRDPDWGVPRWKDIHRWVARTTETDEAFCLVAATDEGDVVGSLLASVGRHPATPACSESSRSSARVPASTRTSSSGGSSTPGHLGP
jgi:hypothetical protein